ncbi:MAG: ABC transporter ATP-binding protein [Candidatus Levybacteria bacterium]|nr:ABC transporter ATP-binding protein [Candidatus Levybacteria bacterium]
MGFLGVNGAGKTTTLQMLLGVLAPTKGEITYFGKNFFLHREEVLEDINFSSTYTNLPWNITVKENLTFISYLYSIKNRKKRVAEIIETFKLEELQNKPMSDLSAGQLTRVNIAKSFLNYPKILLLDEPTASLDIDIADYIRKFLLKQKDKWNTSIIITSHNMAEVEEISDRVIIINAGKVVANDTPENLAKSIQMSHIKLLIKEGLKKAIEYCIKKNISHIISNRYITVDIAEKNIGDFLKDLAEHEISYEEISIDKPTLEDYFFQVIEKK